MGSPSTLLLTAREKYRPRDSLAVNHSNPPVNGNRESEIVFGGLARCPGGDGGTLRLTPPPRSERVPRPHRKPRTTRKIGRHRSRWRPAGHPLYMGRLAWTPSRSEVRTRAFSWGTGENGAPISVDYFTFFCKCAVLLGSALRAPRSSVATELSGRAAGTTVRARCAVVGSANRAAFCVDGVGGWGVRRWDHHPGRGRRRHDQKTNGSPGFQHEAPPVTSV